MRILAVIIAHPLRKVAGATIAGRELSLALAKLVDIELAIMWERDETFKIDDLTVRHMRAKTFLPGENAFPRPMRIPFYQSQIPALIENGDYDLVHIHNLLPAFAAESVARACRSRGIPYVISSHGFNEQSRFASLNGFRGVKKALAVWAIEKPFRRVIRGASAILALSDREGELLSSLGVARDRVHVVPNGVREFFLEPPSDTELEQARAKFGLGKLPVLMFMGSLHGYKGLDIFLKSLGKLQTPFQAVVAGQFHSDAERAEILRQANLPHEVEQSIVFTNAISDAELRGLYHSADVFVYPTKGDTAPLVILEAMACGLPIVSTKVGGIPFMVQEDCGVLVEPNDAESVAEMVDRLLTEPETRAAMGRSAREAVSTRFRWDRSAEAAMTAYQAVLDQQRAKEPVRT